MTRGWKALTGVIHPRYGSYMNTTTTTPGYNTRLAIFFANDKNGRKVAYRWSGRQMRAFRMNLADAEMLIATEAANLLPGHPMKASA